MQDDADIISNDSNDSTGSHLLERIFSMNIADVMNNENEDGVDSPLVNITDLNEMQTWECYKALLRESKTA